MAWNTGVLSKICKVLNYVAVAAVLADFIVRCVAFKPIDKKDTTSTSKAPTDPFYYLLTFYLLPFAVLILVAELEWRPLLKYILFLKSSTGKGFFLMFVGLLIFNPKKAADITISLYLTLTGIFNLVNTWVIPRLYEYAFMKTETSEDEMKSES